MMDHALDVIVINDLFGLPCNIFSCGPDIILLCNIFFFKYIREGKRVFLAIGSHTERPNGGPDHVNRVNPVFE
jgi:hypothetical protein